MTEVPFSTGPGVGAVEVDGVWHNGDVVTLTWTSATVNTPCGAYTFAASITRNGTNFQEFQQSSAGPGLASLTLTGDATVLTIAAYTDGYCSTGVMHGASLSGGNLTACQYGTQPQPGVTRGIIVSTGVIDVLLVALSLNPAFAVIFDTFVGTIVWGGVLCADLPPDMPVFTNADYIGGVPNVVDARSRDKWWTALLAVMWPNFCQCTAAPPGRAAPIPPPAPTGTAPDASPVGPLSLTCDNSDICTMLNSMNRLLTAMNQQVSNLRTDVSLLQRQTVPFNYLTGTVHAGLTGNGDFAVSGILAVSVQLTTQPYALGLEAGDPNAYFYAGWITSGPADGWRRSTPVRHNPQWVDVAFDDTIIGYSLPAGAVATITEFSRVP